MVGGEAGGTLHIRERCRPEHLGQRNQVVPTLLGSPGATQQKYRKLRPHQESTGFSDRVRRGHGWGCHGKPGGVRQFERNRRIEALLLLASV